MNGRKDLEELLMSSKASGKMLGIFLMLSLALSAIMVMPMITADGHMATLKVKVKNQILDPVEDATVYCVNVHSGAETELNFNGEKVWYEANVVPGTYEVFASAKDHMDHDPMIIDVTMDNQNIVHPVILRDVSGQAEATFHVEDGNGEALEGATVHLFDGDEHLMEHTNETGEAEISLKDKEYHALVTSKGMITHSSMITGNSSSPQMVDVTLMKAITPENSYRILGDVMSGNDPVPNIEVHLWDIDNGHMVPAGATDDGSISIPAYSSNFHMILESDGYQPLLVESIDLETNTYYPTDGSGFEMDEIGTEESKITTVDLSTAGLISEPTVNTVWTMDANSRLYGTVNDFGNPRMQISGEFYSPDWETVDASEALAAEEMLADYYPAWITTQDFFNFNDLYYNFVENSTDVTISDLEGGVLESANPMAYMNYTYENGDDMEFEIGDDITIDLLSLLPGEEVIFKLPSDYEILGDYGDAVEHPYMGNANWIKVMEPLEFTASEKENPVAEISFVNSYDYYMKEERKYYVSVDEVIHLSGNGSSDEVGTIEEYMWSIPSGVDYEIVDGNLTGGEDQDANYLSIVFNSNRNNFVNITLDVKDSAGDMSDQVDWIHLLPDGVAPTLNDYTLYDWEEMDNISYSGGEYNVEEDIEINFNATDSTDNSEIVDYVWDFGDESGTLNGKNVTHTYVDPGQYNISLKLVDAVDNELIAENRTIVVEDITEPAPIIKFDPIEAKQGDTVELNGSQSYDPRSTGDDAPITKYTWTFEYGGENKTLTGEVVEFTFDIPGDYKINLTVEDEAGLEYWVEKNLFVGGPDLQVDAIEFQDPVKSDLREGDKAKITVLIVNNGLVDAPSGWTIEIYDNDKKIKEEKIDVNISSQETYEYNFTYELKEGERVFRVELDTNDDVAEISEDNNDYSTEADVVESEPVVQWWWFIIALLIVIVVYVIFMKVTRDEWGYEVIVDWWNKRQQS